jgi:hypothetical protein
MEVNNNGTEYQNECLKTKTGQKAKKTKHKGCKSRRNGRSLTSSDGEAKPRLGMLGVFVADESQIFPGQKPFRTQISPLWSRADPVPFFFFALFGYHLGIFSFRSPLGWPRLGRWRDCDVASPRKPVSGSTTGRWSPPPRRNKDLGGWPVARQNHRRNSHIWGNVSSTLRGRPGIGRQKSCPACNTWAPKASATFLCPKACRAAAS